MESNARFALVGFFISVFALIGITIVLWIVGVGASNKGFDTYVVKTDHSVSGLSKDSDVRYKGVKVGRVASIKIDRNNPQFIEIYIVVEKDLPVKTDTKAKISSNGLTGISYVNLIGGSKKAPLLKSVSKEKCPIIKTVPSTLEKLSVSAAQVMHNMDKLLKKLNSLIDKQSVAYVRKTLKNMYETSESAKITVQRLEMTGNRLNKLLDNGNSLVLSIDTNSKNFNLLMQSIQKLSKDTDSFINENRENIKMFTKNGLENLNSDFIELNKTNHELKNLIMQLEQNPSVILKGITIRKGPGE